MLFVIQNECLSYKEYVSVWELLSKETDENSGIDSIWLRLESCFNTMTKKLLLSSSRILIEFECMLSLAIACFGLRSALSISKKSSDFDITILQSLVTFVTIGFFSPFKSQPFTKINEPSSNLSRSWLICLFLHEFNTLPFLFISKKPFFGAIIKNVSVSGSHSISAAAFHSAFLNFLGIFFYECFLFFVSSRRPFFNCIDFIIYRNDYRQSFFH